MRKRPVSTPPVVGARREQEHEHEEEEDDCAPPRLTFGFPLPGCLSAWQSEPYADWPMQYKGVYRRLLKQGAFPRGCAAYATQGKARCIAAGGSGAWTAALAREHSMTTSCCRDESILRAALALLSCTEPDTDREGAGWALLRERRRRGRLSRSSRRPHGDRKCERGGGASAGAVR